MRNNILKSPVFNLLAILDSENNNKILANELVQIANNNLHVKQILGNLSLREDTISPLNIGTIITLMHSIILNAKKQYSTDDYELHLHAIQHCLPITKLRAQVLSLPIERLWNKFWPLLYDMTLNDEELSSILYMLGEEHAFGRMEEALNIKTFDEMTTEFHYKMLDFHQQRCDEASNKNTRFRETLMFDDNSNTIIEIKSPSELHAEAKTSGDIINELAIIIFLKMGSLFKVNLEGTRCCLFVSRHKQFNHYIFNRQTSEIPQKVIDIVTKWLIGNEKNVAIFTFIKKPIKICNTAPIIIGKNRIKETLS